MAAPTTRRALLHLAPEAVAAAGDLVRMITQEKALAESHQATRRDPFLRTSAQRGPSPNRKGRHMAQKNPALMAVSTWPE
jgi:hypothetical protein